jgi:hypothetical protein
MKMTCSSNSPAHRKAWIAASCLAILAFILGEGREVQGNAGYVVGVKGGVMPLDSSDIELVEEVMLITTTRSNLLDDDAVYLNVESTFLFKNTSGGAVKIRMGFPEQVSTWEEYDYEEDEVAVDDVVAMVGFTVTVDGKPIEHEVIPAEKNEELDLEYDRYYVWSVSFAPGQTRKVVTSYVDHCLSDDFGEPSEIPIAPLDFNYVLRTGKLWKGKIGKFTLRLDPGDRICFLTECMVPTGEYDIPSVDYRDDPLSLDMSWVPSIGKAYPVIVEDENRAMEITWNLEDFDPDDDIWLPIVPISHVRSHLFDVMKNVDLDSLTRAELDEFRYTLLALSGVALEGEWRDHFEKKNWYVVDPNMTVMDLPDEVALLHWDVVKLLEE